MSLINEHVKRTRPAPNGSRRLVCKCGSKRSEIILAPDDIDGEYNWVYIYCARCGLLLYHHGA